MESQFPAATSFLLPHQMKVGALASRKTPLWPGAGPACHERALLSRQSRRRFWANIRGIQPSPSLSSVG